MAATYDGAYGSIARTLRLSITGECNLECFYCRFLGHARDLCEVKTPIQHSDVTKLVKILGEKGVNRVVISGGEPLLRKDAPNFIKSAFAHKAIQDVRLITNGTYLKGHADGLRKMGLKKVDVNVDTLSYKKYQTLTKRDDLFRVKDGVEKLEKLNYSEIRVNVFLLKGINDEEVVDFARETKTRKIHVRFLEYESRSTGNGDAEEAARLHFPVLAAKRIIDNYQRLVQIPDLASDFPVATFRFVDGVGKISFLSLMEVEREAHIPTVAFSANGVFFNEAAPNRGHAILADLRRDAKEGRLHRTIEKVLGLHTLFPPKRRGAEPAAPVQRASSRSRVSAERR
jgi:GTP 3',8-cyclase